MTEYEKLFDNIQAELWPGCMKMSALNFMVKLTHIKVLNKWTNTSLDQLLEMLKISYPDGNKIPNSHYHVKKNLRGLVSDTSQSIFANMIVRYFGKRMKICNVVLYV